MSAMVERVARAIAASHYPKKETDFMWRHMVPDAIAAIEAMRAVDEQMVAAGRQEAMVSGMGLRGLGRCFVAMIDASLSPSAGSLDEGGGR